MSEYGKTLKTVSFASPLPVLIPLPRGLRMKRHRQRLETI